MLERFSGIVNEGTEEDDLLKKIDESKIPDHIAVIMDGNGRWAESKGRSRIEGHKVGAESARLIAENCARLNIGYLTLFTFSSENWKRPKKEVSTLMKMLYENLIKNSGLLEKNNIRLSVIGDIEKLPELLKNKLKETIKSSGKFSGMNLTLALNYGSRDEIIRAAKKIVKDGVGSANIDEDLFRSYLQTGSIPDPDLLIRTSGEMRISNFLLFQTAYSELYFTETLWPDFRLKEFLGAIIEYQKRERRYGAI